MGRMPDEGLRGLGGRKKLSPQEREFMEVIWEKPEGIMSEELYRRFPIVRGTVSAVLAHIAEKNYVTVKKEGRTYRYRANVTKREYEKALMKEKMKKYLGVDSMAGLLGLFCGKEELTEKEKKEIDTLLKKLEEQ